VFATNVSDGLARLNRFQDGDDLRLAEFALSHSASWRHTRPETSTFQWPGFKGGLHRLYARFKDEVKIVQANSDIDGVLPIIDSYLPSDTENDLPWFVMPLVQPIEKYLTGRSFESSIDVVLSIGKLLSQLHQRGICHRDVKPANILSKDGKFYLSDFGLADFPDKPAYTVQGERIGALATMAPEMKLHADEANGFAADVYSLAKTLWIFLTGRSDGFDGQYNPNSINGLRLLNLTEPTVDGVLVTTPVSLYVRPLDELLSTSTSDDPSERPTIEEFINELSSWIEIYKDFQKRNSLQWSDLQKRLFPFNVPQRAIWEGTDKIVEILNLFSSSDNLNHMLLPGGGGMDLLGCQIGDETDTIELIVSDKIVYSLKPKRLIFENFDYGLEWNYLRLESSKLDETGLAYVHRGHEDLVQIEPEKFVSRSYWEWNEHYNEALKFVCRYLEGDFLIVQKTSIYNRISYTYDGRHSQMNTDQFRLYMNGKVRMAKLLLNSERVTKLATENSVSVDDVVFSILHQIFGSEYLGEYQNTYANKS
jgi:serine/threonine-protein kinase